MLGKARDITVRSRDDPAGDKVATAPPHKTNATDAIAVLRVINDRQGVVRDPTRAEVSSHPRNQMGLILHAVSRTTA